MTCIVYNNIQREDSRLGDWVTLLQISCVVLLSLRKRCRRRRRIPLRVAILCAFLYYMSNSFNTWSLQYGISVPLYIVFRSSSLLMTFLCSLGFQRKPFHFSDAFSVIVTSCGLFIVSWASGADSKEGIWDRSEKSTMKGFIFILLGSSLSPLLSVVQEEVLSLHENKAEASEELLFYMQLFSLVGYLFQARQLFSLAKGRLFSLVITRAQLFRLVLVNMATQVICIRSVFALSAETSSVALQMALSMRKLISLLLSYYVFNHSLPKDYWIGTTLTFVGSLLYSVSRIRRTNKVKE